MVAILKEHHLVPYVAAELPLGPWLVFAPHPDDEVFGPGGTLARGAQIGIRIEVVVMTSGDQAGAPEVRKRESMAAAEVLGIRQTHFWDLPDRAVDHAQLPFASLQKLLTDLKPQTIFLPGLQEYHPDHRATTLRLFPLLKEIGHSGLIWLYEISRHNEANRLVDITATLAAKVRAIRCFNSQLACNAYEETVLGINRARSYTLSPTVTHAEAFMDLAGGVDCDGGLSAVLLAACRRYCQGFP